MSEQVESQFDSRTFRFACGCFATGITVITTEIDGEIHGMTANAFMSVSLDPPLVVVSVDHKARLHDLIPQSGKYAVSILSKEQADYSSHFAGWAPEGFEPQFERRNGQPVIAGAIAHLVTTLYESHVAGDHTLYFGKVEHVEYNEEDPVLYYRGQYRQVATAEAA